MARHDAMSNQAAIASFRVVAAEAGGVAATGTETARAASEHQGWLNQADSYKREHGYNRLPHRVSLQSITPLEYNTFAVELFGGRTSFARKKDATGWPRRVPTFATRWSRR
jgi:hypothetical protein